MTAEERVDEAIEAWAYVSTSLYDILVVAFHAHARDAVRAELESLREWVKQAYIDRAAVRDEITRRLGAVDSEKFDMDARLKALEGGE